MPQLTSVVLTDRASTPVDHTFTPRSLKNDVAELVEIGSVPIGEKKLTLSMKKSGSYYKGELRLSLPALVTETINGVSRSTVARTATAVLTVQYHESSTDQERKDLTGMVRSALDPSKALVDDTLVDLGSLY